jgi:hypothetical protein
MWISVRSFRLAPDDSMKYGADEWTWKRGHLRRMPIVIKGGEPREFDST